MVSLDTPSCRSSTSDNTLCNSQEEVHVVSNRQQQHKQKRKINKQQGQTPSQKSSTTTARIERPLFQILGEELLRSTRLHLEPLPHVLPKMPPMPVEVPMIPTPMSNNLEYFTSFDMETQSFRNQSYTCSSLSLGRPSMESSFSGVTKIIRDQEPSSVTYRIKGAVYSLQDFMSTSAAEDLVLRYGRVAHMGVRDHSYQFWMNSTSTAMVHFKVLNKVAVLGGDPICHQDRIALTLKEFELYCRKVGWKIAVVGGTIHMANYARQKGWTCMNFGTERVLNPQTNEVLLGKSGKRIVTQCRQLIDPVRGGITVHTYSPCHGRDISLESSLRIVYDDWRNERNTSRDTQAFVTVFDLFAMPDLMTFLYTTNKSGAVNGLAALRKLGATNGYHIDPFIQTSSAPRGVSDLLIFSSLALLNAQGCSYLSLGYEPVTELSEIWGLPSILHHATKKVYKHVFGKIPIGGKEAFHARWKPDLTQEAPLYLIFVGKIPSPRYILAMTHFANISLRQLVARDWQTLVAKKTEDKKDGPVEIENSNNENLTLTQTKPEVNLSKKARIQIASATVST